MVKGHCQMLVSLSGAVRLKKGRETVENEPHERRPGTSITGENSDRVDALIWEKGRINVRELSGILNISDGSVKTIIIKRAPSILQSVCLMDPAFIDGRTQEYMAASGAIFVVAVQAGRGRFFGFHPVNGQDVGVLLHAREQTFFNAVASRRVPETQKCENHVLCWEGYDHHLLGL